MPKCSKAVAVVAAKYHKYKLFDFYFVGNSSIEIHQKNIGKKLCSILISTNKFEYNSQCEKWNNYNKTISKVHIKSINNI